MPPYAYTEMLGSQKRKPRRLEYDPALAGRENLVNADLLNRGVEEQNLRTRLQAGLATRQGHAALVQDLLEAQRAQDALAAQRERAGAELGLKGELGRGELALRQQEVAQRGEQFGLTHGLAREELSQKEREAAAVRAQAGEQFGLTHELAKQKQGLETRKFEEEPKRKLEEVEAAIRTEADPTLQPLLAMAVKKMTEAATAEESLPWETLILKATKRSKQDRIDAIRELRVVAGGAQGAAAGAAAPAAKPDVIGEFSALATQQTKEARERAGGAGPSALAGTLTDQDYTVNVQGAVEQAYGPGTPGEASLHAVAKDPDPQAAKRAVQAAHDTVMATLKPEWEASARRFWSVGGYFKGIVDAVRQVSRFLDARGMAPNEQVANMVAKQVEAKILTARAAHQAGMGGPRPPQAAAPGPA